MPTPDRPVSQFNTGYILKEEVSSAHIRTLLSHESLENEPPLINTIWQPSVRWKYSAHNALPDASR